ncbi:hypothetical protein CF67_04132 [Candidatus Photodesmus blepharus]|uniref:DUF721 domain-containing protein n=2 Tax=Candidatus Photodesmus blepharonis TaxID=1179155 RepID=A0A084CMV4_9GAMM|nr:hypothetical protein CF67_04132 [Candidatus Photodesmus blepharus]
MMPFMRNHRPTLFQNLISKSELNSIQKHAEKLLKINQELKKILSKKTVNYYRVANVRKNCLIIESASASLKIKIDSDIPMILNRLKDSGFGYLTKVRIKINPDLYRNKQFNYMTNNPEKEPKTPSKHTTQAILMSSKITSSKIQKRLKKLVELGKINKKNID